VPENFVVVAGYANPDDQKVSDFIKAYEKKYNSKITFNLYYISSVYDMIVRVKNAMLACGSADNIHCIRDNFKNATSYEGISGRIKIDSIYSPKSSIMPLGLLTVDSHGDVFVRPLE